jgi:hypothetical protein
VDAECRRELGKGKTQNKEEPEGVGVEESMSGFGKLPIGPSVHRARTSHYNDAADDNIVSEKC